MAGRRANLRALNVEIDDDWFLSASHNYGFYGFVDTSVHLLVRYEGRHVDEITRTSLGYELQTIAPPKSGPALDDVQHGFEFAMVMGTGLDVWLDHHGSGRGLTRACDAWVIALCGCVASTVLKARISRIGSKC